MVDINWDEAPEGTTHVLLGLDGNHHGHWRKVEDGQVFNIQGGRWDRINNAEDWFREFGNEIVERPPKESPLPNGLRWVDKATHYYSNNIVPLLFFNEEGYTTSKVGSKWIEWEVDLFKWYAEQAETTARYPLGQPMEVAQPKPRKPVGWWS